MSALEDRLRADLPALADALTDSGGDRAHASLTHVGVSGTSPQSSGEKGKRLWSRTSRRAFLGAAAAIVVTGFGLALDRDSRTTVDTAGGALAPRGFGTWTTIPESPLPATAYPVSVWTGTEALFWAGSNLSRNFAYSGAAAYDPERGTWREVASPGWGHPGLTGVVLDGTLYALAKGGGARFDLETEEWGDLPQVEGMFFNAVVATDDAIWGVGPAATNVEGQPDLAIARYEPSDDTWVHGPVFEGTDDTVAVVDAIGNLNQQVLWTGSQLVIWSDQGGIGFDPAQQRWNVLPELREPAGEV